MFLRIKFCSFRIIIAGLLLAHSFYPTYAGETARLDGSDPNDVAVALSQFYGCVLTRHDVKCWNTLRYDMQLVPLLRRPTQLALGDKFVCALDDSGVTCWGDAAMKPSFPTAKAVAIAAGSRHACAILMDSVKCWGENREGQLNVPLLKKPTQVYASDSTSCAIDSDGVKCWGDNIFRSWPSLVVNRVPKLTQPRYLNIEHGICALDSTNAHCWSGKEEESVTPASRNAVKVFRDSSWQCLVDQTGIHCSGTISKDRNQAVYIPQLNHPRNFVRKDNTMCATVDTGVRCWSLSQGEDIDHRFRAMRDELTNLWAPSLNWHWSSMEVSLDRASRYFYRNKAEILIGAKHFIATEARILSDNLTLDDRTYAREFVLETLAPLFETTTSEQVRQLSDRFHVELLNNRSALHLNSVIEIPSSPLVIKAAVELTKLYLISSKDLVLESHLRSQLETAILEVGVIDASDQENGDALLRMFADHRPLFEALKVNSRALPIAAGLAVIENFLVAKLN